jgi:hypothetical protein
MGVGVEARNATASRATGRSQPEFGAYVEAVEIGPPGDDRHPESEHSTDRFARRAHWPVLLAVTLLQIAWLGILVHAVYRFVVMPIVG